MSHVSHQHNNIKSDSTTHYNSHVNEQNKNNKNNINNQHDNHEYFVKSNAKGNGSNAMHTLPSTTPSPRLTRVNTEIYNSASISAGNSCPAIVELVSSEPHHNEELEEQKHTHHNSHRHSARHKHGHRESSICFSKREYALLPRSCAIPRLIAETLRRHLD